MLSVQSVNLMRQPAFSGSKNQRIYIEDEPYAYEEKQYKSDKTKLETHLDELNAVIENADVPKPIRAIGKVVSVGIGAALGFVSLKYGTQGVAKLAKSGIKYAKTLGEKPFLKSAISKTESGANLVKDSAVAVFNKIAKWTKDSKFTQKAVDFFGDIGKKYKDTKFANSVSKYTTKLSDLKPIKVISAEVGRAKNAVVKKASEGYKKVAGLTGEQIEKGVVNLFAVSGGVTGGVTALQEVTSDR